MLNPDATPDDAKKSIIALLFQLKDVDNEETQGEIGYILHVAFQLGLTESDVEEIGKNKEKYSFTPPTEERERVMILYYFLFFMSADGEIKKSEERLVKEFGFKLGFRPDLTDDLIGVLKDHANESIPPEKLLEKIRAYLN